MSEDRQNTKGKRGCAPLGCLIIVIAVVAVVFYFIVRPALNERGVTVESVKEKIDGAEERVNDKISAVGDKFDEVEEGADKLHGRTIDKLNKIKQQTRENIPSTPIRLYEE